MPAIPAEEKGQAGQGLQESLRKNSAFRQLTPAWEYAKKHLQNDQWSPEQITGRLELEGLETISHETIYQRILEDKKAGGTIIGAHDSGAVTASMVERKSRFTCLAKAENKTTTAVINKQMLPIADLVLTITLDNGKEFSQHGSMSNSLNADVFFAKPYRSWKRGLNENTNGLVRQYFPKRIPFDRIAEHDLQRVAKKINNRPRKCLGYKTPFEVFSKSCEKRGVALRI